MENKLFEVQLIRFGEYCEDNETLWVSEDLSLEEIMDAIRFCLALPQWHPTWTGIQIDAVENGK